MELFPSRSESWFLVWVMPPRLFIDDGDFGDSEPRDDLGESWGVRVGEIGVFLCCCWIERCDGDCGDDGLECDGDGRCGDEWFELGSRGDRFPNDDDDDEYGDRAEELPCGAPRLFTARLSWEYPPRPLSAPPPRALGFAFEW